MAENQTELAYYLNQARTLAGQDRFDEAREAITNAYKFATNAEMSQVEETERQIEEQRSRRVRKLSDELTALLEVPADQLTAEQARQGEETLARLVLIHPDPAEVDRLRQRWCDHRRRAEAVAKCFEVIASHEGPAQKETGRSAFIRFLSASPDAIVCTNNFLGQGVLDSIAQIENPLVIGCFDEVPMIHLLPIPIACSVQDVAGLAEGCVRLLLPQLQGSREPQEEIVLPATLITNPAFRARQFDAANVAAG